MYSTFKLISPANNVAEQLLEPSDLDLKRRELRSLSRKRHTVESQCISYPLGRPELVVGFAYQMAEEFGLLYVIITSDEPAEDGEGGAVLMFFTSDMREVLLGIVSDMPTHGSTVIVGPFDDWELQSQHSA